ncbi:MAG: tRNA dimethylallyltransferase, partial [Candidatus Hydrogenedentes bacterium]|nr:tRNA dimethylallyltransferase [Candidatus Hydrogenedentota bacterium]
MKSVVAVVGPTASGKTALAIALAERLDTEIVSADSMQFYRAMEIGTAAPTPAERARVKHHFTGILDPGEVFSAGA